MGEKSWIWWPHKSPHAPTSSRRNNRIRLLQQWQPAYVIFDYPGKQLNHVSVKIHRQVDFGSVSAHLELISREERRGIFNVASRL